jgi:hypothetical protein
MDIKNTELFGRTAAPIQFDHEKDGLIVVSGGKSEGTEIYTASGERLHGITDIQINVNAEDGVTEARFSAVGVRLGFPQNKDDNVKADLRVADDTASYWQSRSEALQKEVNQLRADVSQAADKGFRLGAAITRTDPEYTSGYAQAEDDGVSYETTISCDSGGNETECYPVSSVYNQQPCCGNLSQCASNVPTEVHITSDVERIIRQKTIDALETLEIELANRGFVSED